jgi:hypothetical protein
LEGDYPKVAMSEFTAKPEQTYGLVVGIEKYQESRWNVNGPANDALKFARWLCARGVPEDNIRLCLSPLEENGNLVEQPDLAVEEATEPKIASIITDFLSEKKGDLLYIFWAGHGLITSERNRRLLCADATKRNWQNLDLDSLLVFLGSDAFQIRHHICIVDACANYILESKGRPTNLGGKTFSSGQPRTESQQFVLLATREGEQAKVNSNGKTGYFSQAVREALEQESERGCLPNMKAIAEKVKQRFAGLDKKQLPTYYYRRSWDGDTDIYHPNPFDVPHNTRNSTARKFVGRETELERLHQLLQDNNVVAITDVTGRGGVGKTELATQYSWQHLEDYPGGCCWLNPQEADLGTQLVEFATDYLPNFTIPIELKLARKVAYCWRNWQLGNVLLVFDDVEDLQQIQPCLPPMGSRFKVLITTRRLDLPFTPLPLEGLQPDAALELLAKLLGEEVVKQQSEFARQLCEFVNYKPLGLYQIAALRSESGRTSC